MTIMKGFKNIHWKIEGAYLVTEVKEVARGLRTVGCGFHFLCLCYVELLKWLPLRALYSAFLESYMLAQYSACLVQFKLLR